MSDDLDYLDHLARESARFGEVVLAVPPDAQVPSCPDWNADDLLWHLTEVQWRWGTIVRSGLTETSEVKAVEVPDRPGDRSELSAFYAKVSRDLGEALAAASPDTPAWTWSQDHTVGFIRRRQAHEALIHRVDAELTAGDRTPMDPALSADGVDEVLRVMYGGCPPWGTITPESPPRTLRLRATDTGHSWLVTLARFTGTDPSDNTAYDEPDIHIAEVDPGDPADATVSGDVADLDCWLWRRPTVHVLERAGDEKVLADFEARIASGID